MTACVWVCVCVREREREREGVVRDYKGGRANHFSVTTLFCSKGSKWNPSHWITFSSRSVGLEAYLHAQEHFWLRVTPYPPQPKRYLSKDTCLIHLQAMQRVNDRYSWYWNHSHLRRQLKLNAVEPRHSCWQSWSHPNDPNRTTSKSWEDEKKKTLVIFLISDLRWNHQVCLFPAGSKSPTHRKVDDKKLSGWFLRKFLFLKKSNFSSPEDETRTKLVSRWIINRFDGKARSLNLHLHCRRATFWERDNGN